MEKKDEKRDKRGLLYICGVIGALAAGGICIFALPQQTYSAQENRYLTTRPQITVDGIFSGEVQQDLTEASNDQFPGRDLWMQTATASQYLLYHRELNGVYIGKNGYLFDKVVDSDLSEENYKKNIGFITALRENADTEVSVMLVPTKTWIMQEKLPAFAPTYDEQQVYDRIEKQLGDLADEVMIPVAEKLQEHTGEQIYYRTDHHWTTPGAWYGYLAYVEANGGDVDAAEAKRDFACVSTQFYGSTYAKVNQAPRADEIEVYEPKRPLTVVYNMGEQTSDSLYDESFLDSQDQYSYFTGGNQPVVEVTGGADNGQILMVIKDSFANCMIPFLAEDYEKVVMVDLRQLNVKCKDLVQMFDPTDILILYNTAQFDKDRDFAMKCR